MLMVLASPGARCWTKVRPAVLACMAGVAACVGRWPDEWYVPLMAATAASIPSSGAPVAGGIVFVPVLRAHGMAPRDAVAFSALTQLVGCGVLTPLNWLAFDPDVLDHATLRASLPPASAGMLASLTVMRARGCHADHAISLAFSSFCGVLAVYCAWLLCRAPSASAPPAHPATRVPYPVFVLACVLGGLLTGYIGVAIEKVLFVLMTMEGACVRRATLTSITAVGWASALAVAAHALAPSDPADPGYIGALPVRVWIVALPGVMFGSILGPHVHRLLGSATILTLFAVYLAFDFVHGVVTMGAWYQSCQPKLGGL